MQLYVHYKNSQWLPEGEQVPFADLPIGATFAWAEVIYEKTGNNTFWESNWRPNAVRLSEAGWAYPAIKEGNPSCIPWGAKVKLVKIPTLNEIIE